MSSISLDVWIEDGTDPDVDDLHLIPANGYTVPREGIGIPSRVWVRDVVTSSQVDDEWEVGKRLGPSVFPFMCRIKGTTQSQLDARMDTLITALDQDAFTMRAVMGGVVRRWRCRAADRDEQPFDSLALMRLEQTLTWRIPRRTVPLAGSL